MTQTFNSQESSDDAPYGFAFLNQAGVNGFANLVPSTLASSTLAPSTPVSKAVFRILGIAYDGATTYRSGARLAPRAIRLASHALCDAIHPYFDVAPAGFACDDGDLRFPHTNLVAMRTAVQAQLMQYSKSLNKVTPRHNIILGGDHSITLPVLRVLRAQHDAPLALIHFDAHCDTWTDHFGEASGHGTWVYEAVQEGLINPTQTVQIGLRSAARREVREYIQTQGGMIFSARDLRGLEGVALTPVIAQIMTRIGDAPCYCSFDIDAIDPAFAPATGTPESGGLTSTQALHLIESLASLNFVGMDLCEVAPPFDHADLTTTLAANIVWTYLCGQISQLSKAL